MILFKQKPILCPSSLRPTSSSFLNRFPRILGSPSSVPGSSLRRRRIAAASLLPAVTPVFVLMSPPVFVLVLMSALFALLAAPLHAQTSAPAAIQTESAPLLISPIRPVTRGLLGCYLFDEGTGTVAYDCSPNANTATLGGSGSAPTWSPLGIHLGLPTGSSWQWVATPIPTASVVSFSVGFIADTTNNIGGAVQYGSSQAFLVTSTEPGSTTFSLEAAGPPLNLFDANYPAFFYRTVWAETSQTSLWGHQVLGVTCGVAALPPAINSYYIDGKPATSLLDAGATPTPCNQPAAQGNFVIGGSPTLAENQWSVQGTVTAALVYGVELTPTEQAQNAAYIAALSKSRGYTGVPVASGPGTNHIMMSGDSITDCFGVGYGDCWAHNANHSAPATTLNMVPVNLGLSGSSALGSMQAVIARECTNISPNSPINIVHIFLGTNDLAASKHPPANEEIGAALAHGIQTLHACAAKLGAGMQVGIATILSRGVSGQPCVHDPGKDSLDAYLAANWQSLGADILDDYGASPLGYDGACLNTTNFQGDEIHPTLAGGINNLFPIVVASNYYLTSTQPYPACTAPTLTAPTTLTASNICNNASISSGSVALTLPTCTGFNGTPFYIRNVSSGQPNGSAALSVAAPSSQLLNGGASAVTVPIGSTAMLTSSVATYTGGGCAWDSEILNPATATALTSSSPTLLAGQPITLTAAVSPTIPATPLPGPPPSGTVTFYAGTLALGSATLDSSGNATLVASSIGAPTGTFPVTAIYSGGGAYTGSTSPALPITIQPSPTAVTLSAPASITAGAQVTLTASVTRSTAAGVPTGTVTFSLEKIVLGSATLQPGTAGQATASLTASSAGIAPGHYPLTAAYSGDSADLASKSSSVTIAVTK